MPSRQVPFWIIPVLPGPGSQRPESQFLGNCVVRTPVRPFSWSPPTSTFHRVLRVLPSSLPTAGGNCTFLPGKCNSTLESAEKADSGRGGAGGLPCNRQLPPPTGLSVPPASTPRKSGLGTRGGNPGCGPDFRYFLTVPHALEPARAACPSGPEYRSCYRIQAQSA